MRINSLGAVVQTCWTISSWLILKFDMGSQASGGVFHLCIVHASSVTVAAFILNCQNPAGVIAGANLCI